MGWVLPSALQKQARISASLNVGSTDEAFLARSRSEGPQSAPSVEICMAQQSDRFSISSLS
jgi:hypothetical protein